MTIVFKGCPDLRDGSIFSSFAGSISTDYARTGSYSFKIGAG